MSRKKKHEHVNHERWLVSYADFITLLFAFFVVLFASSQKDKNKEEQMAAAMQVAFAQHGAFDTHASTPALTPSAGATAKPAPIVMPLAMTPEQERIQKRMIEAIQQKADELKKRRGGAKKQPDGTFPIGFHLENEGLVISLQDAGFFDSGSAELRADSLPLLNEIAANLPAGRVRVEGHTDNVVVRGGTYRSNWELSTARATVIARVLLERSLVNPAMLSIAGYGEYHPVASNATEEGRARNRRVDIVLLRDKTPAPPVTASPNRQTNPLNSQHDRPHEARAVAETNPPLLPAPSQ